MWTWNLKLNSLKVFFFSFRHCYLSWKSRFITSILCLSDPAVNIGYCRPYQSQTPQTVVFKLIIKSFSILASLFMFSNFKREKPMLSCCLLQRLVFQSRSLPTRRNCHRREKRAAYHQIQREISNSCVHTACGLDDQGWKPFCLCWWFFRSCLSGCRKAKRFSA